MQLLGGGGGGYFFFFFFFFLLLLELKDLAIGTSVKVLANLLTDIFGIEHYWDRFLRPGGTIGPPQLYNS